MSFSEAPDIRFWKASDGVTGIRPPTRPNLRSRDSCTDSTNKNKFVNYTFKHTTYILNIFLFVSLSNILIILLIILLLLL